MQFFICFNIYIFSHYDPSYFKRKYHDFYKNRSFNPTFTFNLNFLIFYAFLYDFFFNLKFRSKRIFCVYLVDWLLIGIFIFFGGGITFFRIPRSRVFDLKIWLIFLDISDFWRFSMACRISRDLDLFEIIFIFIKNIPKGLKFELFLRFIRFY